MVQVLTQQVPRQRRVERNPEHTFHLKTRPWQIQPCAIAPVLPGETLKNALMQSRVVTKPLKNPFIGWWTEYMLFYVKHRDLEQSARDAMVDLMLDPTANLTSLETAAAVKTYHYANSVDFVQLCLTRVVEEYFRDESETYAARGLVDGLPVAAAVPNNSTWTDSLIDTTVLPDGGVAVDGTSPTTDVTYEAFDAKYQQWEFLRANKLIDMTYEDYLRSFGVRVADPEKPHIPELLRHWREWTYPTNTVDPATGIPSTAASWAIQGRADKDRLFKEPGFVFMVTVTRPKVYMSKQKGAATAMLNTPMSWLPALLRDEPYTSMREFANNAGPLVTTTNGYWVDVRDLFLYGDQFLNFAITDVGYGEVALPTVGMEKKYPDATDMDNLFSGTDGADRIIQQDGILKMSILGTLQDWT